MRVRACACACAQVRALLNTHKAGHPHPLSPPQTVGRERFVTDKWRRNRSGTNLGIRARKHRVAVLILRRFEPIIAAIVPHLERARSTCVRVRARARACVCGHVIDEGAGTFGVWSVGACACVPARRKWRKMCTEVGRMFRQFDNPTKTPPTPRRASLS